jgi:hypothetical protein
MVARGSWITTRQPETIIKANENLKVHWVTDICFCTTEDHLELFVRDYCILKGRSPMVVLSPYTSASLQMSKMLMSDAPHEIDKKIRIMYCPSQYIHGNPIIDIARRMVKH